jgi:hypothetical protein
LALVVTTNLVSRPHLRNKKEVPVIIKRSSLLSGKRVSFSLDCEWNIIHHVSCNQCYKTLDSKFVLWLNILVCSTLVNISSLSDLYGQGWECTLLSGAHYASHTQWKDYTRMEMFTRVEHTRVLSKSANCVSRVL